MNVIAFPHRCHDPADVLTVFDHRVADRQVLQRDLVADGDVLVYDGAKLAVILGNDAEHVGTGSEILDDDHADVITAVVREQVRYLCHSDAGVTQVFYKI
jgi:hypothetical protein